MTSTWYARQSTWEKSFCLVFALLSAAACQECECFFPQINLQAVIELQSNSWTFNKAVLLTFIMQVVKTEEPADNYRI